MIRFLLLLGLLLPLAATARQPQPLELPSSARILGMAGSFVAVADDPSAGFLNPSGLRGLKQVGYDIFYGSRTHRGPDHLGVSLSNPGTERGTAFSMGAWAQGLTERRQPTYYVPFTGSSFDLTSSTHFGLVLRFPYIASHDSTVRSRWETAGDLTALQTFDNFRLGVAMERLFGGAGDLIPRRLRVGTAFYAPTAQVTLSYEWRGEQTKQNFHFGYSTSRYGAEVPMGKYTLLRAGYVAGREHRIAFGLAVGTPTAGWRVEGGWELPAATHGETRWALGLGYRI